MCLYVHVVASDMIAGHPGNPVSLHQSLPHGAAALHVIRRVIESPADLDDAIDLP